MRDITELSYMIIQAVDLCNQWEKWSGDPECRKDKKAFADAVRNTNALRGVIKTLRWVRQDPGIDTPLE